MKALTKQITINPSYGGLVHPLTENEYLDLKQSMAESGQFVPIIVNTKGIILDGHHRWKICRELSIKPKITTKDFESPLFEKLFVIDCNLKRRHLNSYQKGVLTLKKKPIYEEIAKKNMFLGGRGDKILTPLNRVNGKLGGEVGISHETIRKIEIIQKKASEEDKQKLLSGQKTISKIYRKIQKEEKRQELMMMPTAALPKNLKLILGNFETLSKKIPDNSISLIFTDPLYGAEGLPLYEKLGILANRVLQEGGSLVTYTGQFHLNTVFKLLESNGLKYWWTICVKHAEDHQLVYARNVFCEWKPLLWFVKGEKPNIINKISDHIESTQPEKLAHKMEQGVIEAEYVIKNLTVENQIVFDPMLGSGTSCIAALGNNRKFIGCEKNKEVFELAKKRISQYLNTTSNPQITHK